MEETKLTFSDYLQILKRRRTLMLLTFLTVLVVSIIAVFALPAKYRSSALIMIEGQDIPEDLVRSTITSYADERVQRITQRTMTSVNLSSIIDQHDLYDWEIERTPRSEIIDDMREDISIDLVAADVIDPRSGRPTKATIAFSIAFDYRDPVAAQKVANDLVTLYRRVNLDEGKSQVEGAADFLEDLATSHQQQVEDLEARLAELKQKHGGALPDLLPTNMQIVQRLDNELSGAESRIQGLKNRVILLEAQLLQTDPNLVGSSAQGQITDPAQALAVLENELRLARSRYGNRHPDVQRYERMVAELRSNTGAVSTATTADTIDQQLAETRVALETARARYGEEHPEIVGLKRRMSNLQDAKVEAVTALVDERVVVSETVSSQINVREGPGLDTPVVGVLARSESATLVDGSNDEWLKILTPQGQQGFVSRSLVQRQASPAALAQAQENGVAEGEVPSNPAYITLQANLAQAQTELQGLVSLYRNLQEKITEKQAVIERTPLVEREYSALLRNLTAARSRLEESMTKAEQARVGAVLVKDGKAQAFNLLEPPIAPTQPHWPNRWALIFLGFALSLVGTVASAALAESVDDSIRSASDISQLGVSPPLAMIPNIENGGDAAKSRTGALIIGGAILAVITSALLALHFLYRPLDVLWFAFMRKVGL